MDKEKRRMARKARRRQVKLARKSQNTASNPRLLRNLVMDIVETARKLYPAYTWAAGPSDDGGSTINLVLMDSGVDQRYGMVWDTCLIQQASVRRREVMMACGSMLERLGMDRARATAANDVTGVERNGRGELVMELGS